MNIRFISLFFSIISFSMYAMQPPKPFYITTSDNQTILIPNELISYFKTLETMREDLGHETDQTHGVPLPLGTGKIINFVLRLARALHEKKNVYTVLTGSMVFLNPEEINEIKNLIQYLSATDAIKKTFMALLEGTEKLNQMTYSIEPTNRITITINGKGFIVERSVIDQIKYIKSMLQEFEKSKDKQNLFIAQPLQFPKNSILNIVKPGIFALLIDIIEQYLHMQKTEDTPVDIMPILQKALSRPNKTISTPNIIELINLVDVLEVSLLEEPLIRLVTSWIENNTLQTSDRAWENLNQNSMYLLRNNIINHALRAIEPFTMQNSEPTLIVSPKIPDAYYVAFAQNGLSAVSETKDTLYFVDLEKKIIAHKHTFPFIIRYIALSDDGSLVAIHRIEGSNQENTLHFYDIKNRKLMPNVLTLPENNEVENIALSPDNQKICIATHQNKIFVYNIKDFTTPLNAQDLNNEEEEELLTRSFRIHWFPNSLKCAVTSFCNETEKNALYIIGTNNNFTNVMTIEEEPSHILALPLDNQSLLCIQEGKRLHIKTFPSDTSITPADKTNSIGLCTTHSPKNYSISAEDALLSNTKKYSLIFAEEGNYIINNETGHTVKTFDSIFTCCFNKNDTGLFAYDYNDAQFKNSIFFYPFMNQESISFKNLLRDLIFTHVTIITKIIHAIADKKRIFNKFSTAEKDILKNISPAIISQIETYLTQLQKFYTEALCTQEEDVTTNTESSTETSSDTDSDAMDVDDINTIAPQQPTPRPEPVAMPQQTQTQQPNQWQPTYEEEYIIDTLPMEIDDEYNTEYFPELSKQFEPKKQ